MKDKLKYTFIISLLFFATLLFAQSASKIEFNAKDINNKTVTSAIFQDSQITMINIWGTFCGPCINEMPDLGKLSNQYDDSKFQIIGIVIDAVNRKGVPVPKTIETAQKIVKQTGADYIHIVPDTKLSSGFLSQVFVVPTTIFVNNKGEIIDEIYTGSRSLTDWQKIIDKIIKDTTK